MKTELASRKRTGNREPTTEQDFVQLVEEHEQALNVYCRFLTGSEWEAKDLLQETWLRIWSSFKTGRNSSDINRSYIRRTAYHAWIDRCRKQQPETELGQTSEFHQTGEEGGDLFTIWSALERLLHHLTPNQRGAVLLMDVYRYTAAETAEMLHMTEGAVKACLHRARQKLKTVQKEDGTYGPNQGSDQNNKQEAANQNVDETMVYAYLQAFKHHNIMALLMLFNAGTTLDVLPAVQSVKAPETNHFHISIHMEQRAQLGSRGMLQLRAA